MTTSETPPAESIEQLARRTFAELHTIILSHEAGSLRGDLESIHDMRVAIRRLRVALNNFAVCLPVADRRRLRSSLENLADALGEVRDLDVMIAAMKSKKQNRPRPERDAIAGFIRRLKARRRSRLRALAGYINGEEYSAFKREFPALTAGSDPDLEFAGIGPKTLEEKHGQAA
jgi:CHAD domain-containing protein